MRMLIIKIMSSFVTAAVTEAATELKAIIFKV
jgi:hypothetical protein